MRDSDYASQKQKFVCYTRQWHEQPSYNVSDTQSISISMKHQNKYMESMESLNKVIVNYVQIWNSISTIDVEPAYTDNKTSSQT